MPEIRSQVTTTATRRVLVRTRVCNTVCAQWGVIDRNAAILVCSGHTGTLRGQRRERHVDVASRRRKHSSWRCAIVHRPSRGSSDSTAAIVLVVVCWICGSFTYSRSGYGKRVSLSPHSTPKQAGSSCRATRPARRTSQLPPRSRTRAHAEPDDDLGDDYTPATYSPARPTPSTRRRRWAATSVDMVRAAAAAAECHDPGAVRT